MTAHRLISRLLKKALPWGWLLEQLDRRHAKELVPLIGQAKHTAQDPDLAVDRRVPGPRLLPRFHVARDCGMVDAGEPCVAEEAVQVLQPDLSLPEGSTPRGPVVLAKILRSLPIADPVCPPQNGLPYRHPTLLRL
ncbi:MAG: hypothetical protein V3T76_03660 [candidate division NC10 bacterium]